MVVQARTRHPFAVNQPGVMSCDEIRYWMGELRRRGWGMHVLSRTLGRPAANPNIQPKIDGRQWIYPSEQKRWSEVLKRILSGELICIPGKKHGRGYTGRAVVATDPQPLVAPTQFVWQRGGLRVQSRGFVRPLPTWRMPDISPGPDV